jgi:hypothetical protein
MTAAKVVETVIVAEQHAFMSDALRERCAAATTALATLNEKRKALASRWGAFVEGTAVTVDADTSAEAVLTELASLRRERLAMPIEGLRLVSEFEAIRADAQTEWGEHKARVDAALDAAVEKATAKAAKLGLSATLTKAYIEEQTTSERQTASASNPCPLDWWGWAPPACHRARYTLQGEFRVAIQATL